MLNKKHTRPQTQVAQFIKKRREELGWPQTKLAEKLGVDPSYLNRIENGAKTPGNIKFLEQLAACLELGKDESEKLFSAAKMSQRFVRLPSDLSPAAYELVAILVAGVPYLNETQLTLLQSIIKTIGAGVTRSPNISANL